MLTFYAAYRNADMTEGKGPMVLDKVFMDLRDALDYIQMQPGVMGRTASDVFGWKDMGDWEVRELKVMQHLQDSEEYERRMLRESALMKLTKEEKEVLGVGDE